MDQVDCADYCGLFCQSTRESDPGSADQDDLDVRLDPWRRQLPRDRWDVEYCICVQHDDPCGSFFPTRVFHDVAIINGNFSTWSSLVHHDDHFDIYTV